MSHSRFHSHNIWALTALALILVMTVVSCAAPTPQVIVQTQVVEKAVVQTQVVEKPVVQTQVVEKQVTAAAPTANPAAACPTAKDHYKIGFANLTEDIVFTQLVEQGMKDAAKASGKVDLVIADNKLDGATALANANNFVTQGVDGVVEFQTDEKFGNVIMDKFRAKKLPVIAIDIPMSGATFFGADNYKAGLLAGEAAAKYANDKWGGQVDAILLLELPQSGPVPAARMQGMLEGLQNNLKTKVADKMVFHLDSKNTQDESFKVVGDTLPKIPNAKHIVGMSINDGSGLGIIAALQAAGRQNQDIVVGQGADPSGQAEMMKPNSLYLGATGYFPEKYGSKIIPAMLDALNCKQIPPAIYMDHVFISKDNLCQLYADSDPCKKK
ncbi:MAG TPA: substrate-binding domain-containing protein [Anaerolineae bacterium]